MPEEYELTTIQDIFDKVPAERIPECCREIGQALAQTALMRELAVACGAQVIGIQWPLVWKDDHKGEIDSVIQADDETGDRQELLRLETRRGENMQS